MAQHIGESDGRATIWLAGPGWVYQDDGQPVPAREENDGLEASSEEEESEEPPTRNRRRNS